MIRISIGSGVLVPYKVELSGTGGWDGRKRKLEPELSFSRLAPFCTFVVFKGILDKKHVLLADVCGQGVDTPPPLLTGPQLVVFFPPSLNKKSRSNMNSTSKEIIQC